MWCVCILCLLGSITGHSLPRSPPFSTSLSLSLSLSLSPSGIHVSLEASALQLLQLSKLSPGVCVCLCVCGEWLNKVFQLSVGEETLPLWGPGRAHLESQATSFATHLPSNCIENDSLSRLFSPSLPPTLPLLDSHLIRNLIWGLAVWNALLFKYATPPPPNTHTKRTLENFAF